MLFYLNRANTSKIKWGWVTGTVICPKCEIILVACSKCDWWAAFARDELIAAHGADYAMPNLLNHLAAPSCSRLGSEWDRCGVHYVEPIEG